MADLIIRNLDDEVEQRLVDLAAERGHSVEEEAREIVRRALGCRARKPARAEPQEFRSVYDVIHGRFAPLGGVELELPQRDEVVGSHLPKGDFE